MPNSCTVDGTSGSQQCIDLEGEKMLSADGVRQPSHLHLTPVSLCDANIGSNGSLPVATCSRSAMARVIVSDTAGTLYDKHCSIGTDIVVANSGACLASNLQVQVLQPMSNTATTKLLVPDALTSTILHCWILRCG
jgi:hypothetical protein